MLRIVERYEPDGRRVEAGFVDCRCSDAELYFGCSCVAVRNDYRPCDHVNLVDAAAVMIAGMGGFVLTLAVLA
jgi:hypothetical protein